MEPRATFPKKLKEVLMELEQEGRLKGMNVEVEPSSGSKFVADVTSASFADIPEEVRQNMVWGKVLQRLDDYDQRRVEFIFTPSPREEIGSGERSHKPKKWAGRGRLAN